MFLYAVTLFRKIHIFRFLRFILVGLPVWFKIKVASLVLNAKQWLSFERIFQIYKQSFHLGVIFGSYSFPFITISILGICDVDNLSLRKNMSRFYLYKMFSVSFHEQVYLDYLYIYLQYNTTQQKYRSKTAVLLLRAISSRQPTHLPIFI